MRRIDPKTLGLMLLALIVGLSWAAYNLALAGPVRGEDTVRPLVWAVFAAPAALVIGWLIARPREIGLASACCFCLYFFSFFVAQRIESLLVTPDQAAASGHTTYFWVAIILHAFVGGGLAIWRARA
ncbi:hypothetical protein K2Z83_12165 [Oscillochloris sp. ZM17-4]|uniref:hypothetical protein n=1 Tax=Oscillochloris sp. ZM17-4 TaxID=2866714 RepID=UPI001C72B155|nr:hypothetical protein [Oscillochloris sp. ZM17-4]MBX0328431.1 hypothetical protein [Oscillochloris sp. ZM17-4]